MRSTTPPVVLSTTLAVFLALPVQATRPLARTEQPADLERGRADGIALTRRGLLFVVPRLEPYGSPLPSPEPAQIWSMAADDDGNVYLGTSPDGRVLKIAPRGETSLLFRAEEPMITALAVNRHGELLAAAAPGGAIYRIDRDGRGEIWSETDELYVWALAPAAGDRVYAGTGERGRILEIQPSGRADLFFDGDESHIVSLTILPGGDLLAGGAARGLVYRIDREGHAMVLHDDDLPEVVALATDGEDVIAALIASPEAETRAPALRLRLPDGVQVGASSEAAGVLEEGAGPTLHGLIEGLPRRPASSPVERLRGRVIRITPGGESRELWSSAHEAPFCLSKDGEGRVLFGTGEPGRLYRIGGEGDPARVATLDEAQVTGLLVASGGVLVATGNPARAYRLPRVAATPGEFVSRPVDAGGIARWGSIAWSPVEEPAIEFYTRTGNSHRPDETWSAWSPALRDGAGSQIVNPDGRFLQWRLRQTARGDEGRAVRDVTLLYEPYNRPPLLEGFRTEPAGGSARGPLELRWSTADPDGDPVRVTVEYRRSAREAWSVVGRAPASDSDDERSDGLREGRLVWDTAAVDEGEYDVRATSNDQAANASGEGLMAANVPVLRVVVDRTPPRIELRAGDDGVHAVLLEDDLSMLRPLQVLEAGEVRFTARPEDGVCDSRRERFQVGLPAGSSWSVRGTDAAGNSIERTVGGSGGAD